MSPKGKSGTRKQRVDLNIAQKLEIIKKLDSDISVESLSEEYGVKKETVLDIYKAKDKIMDFYDKYSVREGSQEDVQDCSAVEARKRMRMSEYIISGKKKCSYCNKTVGSQRALKAHERLHTGKGIFQCSVCGKTCLTKERFIVHFRIHTGEKPFECSLCDKKFSDNSSLKRHEKRHNPDMPYHCMSPRGKSGTRKQRVDLNIAQKLEIIKKLDSDISVESLSEEYGVTKETVLDIYKAKDKIMDFYDKYSVREGSQEDVQDCSGVEARKRIRMSEYIISGKRNCSYCNKTVKSQRALKAHERLHTGKGIFRCSVCGKTCLTKEKFLIHFRIHTGEKPFECSLCHKKFSDNSSLKRHEKTHKPDMPYHCTVCKENFDLATVFREHLKSHADSKKFSCANCDMKFNSKGNLLRHIKIHTGEKTFKCSLCDKSFNQKSYLKRHLRIHTGDKVSCSQCNKTFNTPSNLRIHERVHTGEKPYECSYCGKKFVHSSNCKVHERIHKNERPFECVPCKKSFHTKAKLERHEETQRHKEVHSKVPHVRLGSSEGKEKSISPAPIRKYFKLEQSEEADKFLTFGQEEPESFTDDSNFMLDSTIKYSHSVHGSPEKGSPSICKSPMKYSYSMHETPPKHSYLMYECPPEDFHSKPNADAEISQSKCESPSKNNHSKHGSQPKNSLSKCEFRTGENRPKKLVQNKISSFFPTKEIIRSEKELHPKKNFPDATKSKDDWRVFVSILIVNMEACLKRQDSEKG